MLFAAGTASYECADFKPLDKVPESLRSVAGSLQEMGFTPRAGGYRLNPTVKNLRDSLKDAADAAPVVVCYYTGHAAKPQGDIYYLVSKKSRPNDLPETGLPARDLSRLLMRTTDAGDRSADQPLVLLILDCCFSGSGGIEILVDELRDIGNLNLWVIASAGAVQWAQQGLFAKAFCHALREPRTGDEQPFVSMEDIADQVKTAIEEATAGQSDQVARFFGPATGITGTPPFFPNPKRRAVQESAISGVQGGLITGVHSWLPLVRGGPAGRVSGFYLSGKTGRVRAASDLAGFMRRPSRTGLAIITGGPGTGKSTQLALPLLLTQRSWRDQLLSSAQPGSLIKQAADLLPEGIPIIAVDARGLNTDQAASAIAGALGSTSATAAELLEHLDVQPQQDRVVIVDAVDQARSPLTLFASLLCPLARQPGIRVVAGARPHVLTAILDAELIINLDSTDYQDPDALNDYVYRLLIASEEPDVSTPYQAGQAETARTVATAIARRATVQETGSESFLFGGLMALDVRDRAEPVDATSDAWPSELPTSLTEALEADLARLGAGESVARALLTALAWAKGRGLPWENLWVPVARALAAPTYPDLKLTDGDVRWLLDRAGSYVIEDIGPGERSVFRPFHDLLAVHLRGETGAQRGSPAPVERAEKAVTEALLTTLSADEHGRRDWASAHPYLRTYLAQHAAAAGTQALAALMQDMGFLAVADPITLIPLLRPEVPELRDAAQVYRRAMPLIGDDVRANAAYLQEASVALDRAAARSEGAGIPPLYRTRLAGVRQDDSCSPSPNTLPR